MTRLYSCVCVCVCVFCIDINRLSSVIDRSIGTKRSKQRIDGICSRPYLNLRPNTPSLRSRMINTEQHLGLLVKSNIWSGLCLINRRHNDKTSTTHEYHEQAGRAGHPGQIIERARLSWPRFFVIDSSRSNKNSVCESLWRRMRFGSPLGA